MAGEMRMRVRDKTIFYLIRPAFNILLLQREIIFGSRFYLGAHSHNGAN
jgi:hypothetical protein